MYRVYIYIYIYVGTLSPKYRNNIITGNLLSDLHIRLIIHHYELNEMALRVVEA